MNGEPASQEGVYDRSVIKANWSEKEHEQSFVGAREEKSFGEKKLFSDQQIWQLELLKHRETDRQNEGKDANEQ